MSIVTWKWIQNVNVLQQVTIILFNESVSPFCPGQVFMNIVTVELKVTGWRQSQAQAVLGVKDHLNNHIYTPDRTSRLHELNICHRPLPVKVEKGTSMLPSNSTYSFYVSLPSPYSTMNKTSAHSSSHTHSWATHTHTHLAHEPINVNNDCMMCICDHKAIKAFGGKKAMTNAATLCSMSLSLFLTLAAFVEETCGAAISDVRFMDVKTVKDFTSAHMGAIKSRCLSS